MKTLTTLALATALIASTAPAAFAKDAIEGTWRTKAGALARISPCGGSYCIKLTSGQYKGKSIGKMSKAGGNKYKGSITDPAKNKKYTGKASISGSTMSMSGCVLGGLICQSQKWVRQ